MQILAFFSNQNLVVKDNNSCQKQCFMAIALLNVKTYIQKLSYVFFFFFVFFFFYCNLMYKLKLIKQNVIFFFFFFIFSLKIEIDIQGQ